MDVHAITNVDANVVRAVAPEYEVARLQSHEGNRCYNGLLFVGGTWQADAVFSEYILYETTAVEAAWAGAAPYVWNAEILHSTSDDGTSGAIGDAANDFIDGALVYA